MTDNATIISLAAAVTTLGGAWLTIRKIAKDAHTARKEQAAEILQEAKEADNELRLKMDAKLQALDSKVRNLETSVEKDLDHLRETYNGEIRNLGQKIEDLRSELRNQHGELIKLLTKMVGNKD